MKTQRPPEEKTQQIVTLFKAIGAAALKIDIEDSHSGNIATKWVDEDGTIHMAITATGSQKGDLKDTDICFPGIDRTTYGHYKASSETDIHAQILLQPGVGGSFHAHTKHAVIESFDDRPKPLETPITPLRPLDPLGYHHIGKVPVEWFAVPSGSPEMARLIPEHLSKNIAMIIHAHGTFSRGQSVQEAFYRVALVENLGRVLWFLRIQGLDSAAIADYAYQNPEKHFPFVPTLFTPDRDGECDFSDEPDTVAEFLKTGRRIFESKLSPFHAGSLSLRGANTLLFTPKASMPTGLPGPLWEKPLESDPNDEAELAFHKKIYQNSTFQSIAHTYLAEAEAVAWSVHPKFSPDPDHQGRDEDKSTYIVPVDAEGSFLYLKIPVLSPTANFEEILRALHDYHMIIVRGRGVFAIGEQSLSEVLHRVSPIRDICYYRICAAMRKLNFLNLEPKNARNW